ncbi:hypothetical protein GXW82_10715 [Streptacidiphilus sp. 4-A2]|nr:hypothetical protein [Streptacidiphilus sp. 4-A2]
MVDEGRLPIPEDSEELYRFLMRGAYPSFEQEAAARLAFRVEALRDWLLRNGLIEAYEGQEGMVASRPHARIRFAEALVRAKEAMGAGHTDPPLGPGNSGYVALAVAADLDGIEEGGYWYGRLVDLELDDARHVAEAMLYGAGCLDGTADPAGGIPADELGPASVEYRSRVLDEY